MKAKPKCEKSKWFVNHYVCHDCECEWTDEWSCACDDECPKCGTPYSPYQSEVYDEKDGALIEVTE